MKHRQNKLASNKLALTSSKQAKLEQDKLQIPPYQPKWVNFKPLLLT